MKILTTKDTATISGGRDISEDGVLVTSVEIPKHSQDKILEVTLRLNDSTLLSV